jgi:urea transport system substrate-binding protein
MKRREFLKVSAAGVIAAASGLSFPAIAAKKASIKVGILHSLSGTMAISETALKDVDLMTIAEINAAGGVDGRVIEPVVVDPASNWPLFAEKARQLIAEDEVAAIFGCWTSVSRKSVLPVLDELNGLLFYPVQFEGQEENKHVVYTGAAPNQQAIPAAEYLMSQEGGGAKRFFLLGTDYVYPRTTNAILRGFLHAKGVKDSEIAEVYTPFGFSNYQNIVADIKKFASSGPTCVISTINGDSNVPFYKEMANQGIKATDIPVVGFSIAEQELAGMDTAPLVGYLTAWNYYESLKNPRNTQFVNAWKAWVKAKGLKDHPVTDDPMEASYIGIHMWKQAVEQAKSIKVDEVRKALVGQKFAAPDGYTVEVLPNQYLSKPVYIGQVRDNGQFDVVWKSKGLVPGEAWSPYIPMPKNGSTQ